MDFRFDMKHFSDDASLRTVGKNRYSRTAIYFFRKFSPLLLQNNNQVRFFEHRVFAVVAGNVLLEGDREYMPLFICYLL